MPAAPARATVGAMAISFGVIAIVLMSGALHATWNTLVKTGGDRTVTLSLVIVGSGVFAAPFAFVVPFPGSEAWTWLLLSLLIHLVYYMSLLRAYHFGDFSQVYPIARGLSPALVALGAWLVSGERLAPWEAFGVVVVSLGIASLAFRGGHHADRRGVLFALLTSGCIVSYVLADGTGVRLVANPASYIVWMFLLEGAALLAVALFLRRGRVVESFRPHLKRGLLGGVCAALSYGAVVWALSLGPMAHIVALRETSVLIGAVIGTRVLGEGAGRSRIFAAAAVALGCVIVQTAGG